MLCLRCPSHGSGWTKSPKHCDGGLSGIPSHTGLGLWWVDLSEKGQALASQPGDSPPWGGSQHQSAWKEAPPLGCHHPSVSPPMPQARVRSPGGTEASLQDAPHEIHLGPEQRSLLLCEDGRAPNVISPALCSPTHGSLCKAQLTGRGQLNLTEVQGCLVGKVLAKAV